MIDYFALALTHGLIVLALWRLLMRPDLDRDPAVDEADQDASQSSEESTHGA